MKNKLSRNRLISLALCLALCLALLPTGAMAAGPSDITGITVTSDGTVSWNEVSGAAGYRLIICDASQWGANAAALPVYGTSANVQEYLDECGIASAYKEIRIYAYPDTRWTEGTELATGKTYYDYVASSPKLKDPDGLCWNNNIARWNPIDHAQWYYISVYDVATKSYDGAVFGYQTADTQIAVPGLETGRTYYFEVRATAANYQGTASVQSANMTYALPSISNVSITNGVVAWNAGISGAQYFKVDIMYNDPEKLYTNSYDIQNKLDELCVPDGNVAVTLTAYGSNDMELAQWKGSYTYTSTVPQLDKPTNLRWVGNCAKWDSVENAAGYIVRVYQEGVTGTVYDDWPDDNISKSFPLSSSAKYTFEVVARGSSYGFRNSESAWSSVKTEETTCYQIDVNFGRAVDSNGKEITDALKGTVVTLIADEPPAGKAFDHWEVYSASDTVEDKTSSTTTVVATGSNSIYTACFKEAESAGGNLYVVIAGSLNVRDGVNGNRIGGLQCGDVVQAIGQSGEWTQITYEGKTAWIKTEFLLLTYSNDTAIAPMKYTVKSGSLNVRKDISTGADRIGGLKSGDTILVTGKRRDTLGEEWLVLDYNGQLAYVMSAYLASEDQAAKESVVVNEKITTLILTLPKDFEPQSTSLPAVSKGGSAAVDEDAIKGNSDGSIEITIYPGDGEDLTQIANTGDITLINGEGLTLDSVSVNPDGSLTVRMLKAGAGSCTLTFNLNGHGAAIEAQAVEAGKTAVRPADPAAEGWTFGGWYTDEACTEEFDFDAAVDKGATAYTLYAKWTAAEPEPEAPQPEEPVIEEPAPEEPQEAPAVLPETLPFADVAMDGWYYDAVRFVYGTGLMNGVSGTEFDPNGTTTRAMVATILWRLSGAPEAEGNGGFADVPMDQWYTTAIAWAAKTGLVTGYDEDHFGPNDPITREQLVAILYRLAVASGVDVSVGEDTNILSYNDVFDISEYAIPAFQWGCGAGLVQGTGGNLTPRDTATRAQIATLIMRVYELIK